MPSRLMGMGEDSSHAEAGMYTGKSVVMAYTVAPRNSRSATRDHVRALDGLVAKLGPRALVRLSRVRLVCTKGKLEPLDGRLESRGRSAS